MRKLILVAAVASLAACGSKEEAPADPAETADTTLTDTATGDMSGVYEIKLVDGTVLRQTINADGTYVDTTLEGAETERGTWRQEGDAMCFDPEGDGPEACYTGGAPGEDGTFEVRDAEGNVSSSVRKVEAEAPAAE